jgi:Rad9
MELPGPNILFEAMIPSSSLRAFSRVLGALSRIGDEICFETCSTQVTRCLFRALTSQLLLSAISLSKSAFGIVKLDSRKFFSSYRCPNPTQHQGVLVRCKVQTRVPTCVLLRSYRSYFWAFSRRAISRRARIKIRVLSHVRSKSQITRRLENVDL